MREIKFRAWMIAGKYMKQWEDLEHLNFWAYANHGGIWELMQFTGLHDKNGKELWEGDICNIYPLDEKNYTDQVTFRNGKFCFEYYRSGCGEYKPHSFEIIGNIYENPELIKRHC